MNIYIRSLKHSISIWSSFLLFLFIFFSLGSIKAYSQSNPAAFDLSTGSYTFTTWADTCSAGTYPANMCFHTFSMSEPLPSNVTSGNYTSAYNLTSLISRIYGLGSSGFYFYNMGTGPYLGAAVLSLNTTGRTNIQVTWLGGTSKAAGGVSVYAIRLQYRISVSGTWTDVIGPVEYMQNSTDHYQTIGPTILSSDCDNKAVIQLRWKYYCITPAGTKPKLRLDDITVSSSNMTALPTTQASNITFSNISTTSFTIKCKKGNGTSRLMLIKAGGVVNFIPVNNSCYTANTAYGSGTLLLGGNYSVFSDTDSTCTVTGLAANTIYYVAIYEYNGTCPGSLVSYLTTSPATSSQQTSANPSPLITTSIATVPDFGSTVINSGLGSVQSFTISGAALTNNITITPPSGFDISLSNAPFTSTNPITLTKDANNTIANTLIYVRFSPTILKSYSDTISLLSTGALTKNIKLTGKGIKACPTNHILGLSSNLVTPKSSSILLNWTDASGTILPDAYLIKGSSVSYAAITNPIDGILPASDLLTKSILQGVKTATFTGLNASTTYFFKVFSYSNTSTDVKYKVDGTIPVTTISTIANGTITSPLSCSEAILNNTGLNVWVKGYIVGAAYSDINVESDSASIFQYETNIAIADSMNQTDVTKMLFVKLDPDASNNNNARSMLNIKFNHGNFHKRVLVRGDLMAYWNPHAGMQNTDDFKWFDSPTSIQTGNWNNAYSWTTGIPGVNDDVIINSNINVDASSICNKLSISKKGNLTIGSGNNLNLVDTLTIECGGSLIDYNNQTINADVKRDFASANWQNGSDGWHIVSSPVTNQTINGNWTSGSYDFYSFDEPSNQWLNQKTIANNITNFVVGKAYLASYATDTNKQFNGILNNNDVLVNLTYTASGGKGYNLLGNPYPSAIKWNNNGVNWNLTNVESIAKIWNECNQTYSLVFNDSIIPSNQGFFVKANAPVSGFIIPKAARINHSHCYFKSKASKMLSFNVSNFQNDCKLTSYIVFDALATPAYDLTLESTELQGSSIAPRFYSVLSSGEKLSVNALPIVTTNSVVNMGFVAGVNGIYSIKLDNDNITDFYSIVLKDMKTDSTQNLLIKPVFNFMANTLDNPDRFKLYLNVTNTAGINSDNDIENNIKVVINDKTIVVNSKDNIKEAEVYNIIGQKIFSNKLINNNILTIDLKDKANGIYILESNN